MPDQGRVRFTALGPRFLQLLVQELCVFRNGTARPANVLQKA